MLLLHVSDIHFQHPICDSGMDPDRPFRTLLIQDARRHAAELGPVDAILVTGDIAYCGARKEYQAASDWLRELATAVGCRVERIFVVPGNHDVDRDVTGKNPSVRNVQTAIRNAKSERREKELFIQFRDADTSRALLASLSNYNDFAATLNCQVFSPDRLFWTQDLPLDDDMTLRIHGLTSTLLSGLDGKDDARGALYLSPLQTVLDPEESIVNLVMCHHPPDWLLDVDAVEDAFRGRANIHMFGHKHRQRIEMDASHIRLSAGAVNPDRDDANWEPGYNLLRLSTCPAESGALYLQAEAHLRVWQTAPDRFRAREQQDGNKIFKHQIVLHRARGSGRPAHLPKRAAASDPQEALGAPPPVNVEQPPENQGPATGDTHVANDRARHLVSRFWDLPTSKRRELATTLHLIDGSESGLPEPERYGRALLRAKERGLLDRLADLLKEMESS